MKRIKHGSNNNRIEVITKKRNTVIDYVRGLRTMLAKYEVQSTYAMDEIAILFDELGLKNFEFTDNKEETTMATNKLNVLLTIGADGSLLHGLAVLHKEIQNLNVPGNIYLIITQHHADLDNNVFKYYAAQVMKMIWLRNVLIINELLHAQFNAAVLRFFNEVDSKLVRVPRGYKSLLHPMEVCMRQQSSIKQVFKDYLAEEWTRWFRETRENPCGLSVQTVLDMISASLNKLKKETDLIKNVCFTI